MKLSLSKFKNSKFGWGVLISLFAVWFFFVASITAGLVSVPVAFFSDDEDLLNVFAGLVFPALFLIGSVFMSRLFFGGKNLKEHFVNLGFRIPRKNALWLTPLILVGYTVLLLISISVLINLSPELAEQEQAVAEVVKSLGGWRLLAMILSVGILTPIAEEAFFRGLLIPLYGKKLKIFSSILIPAALFGLAHGQINVGIDTFIFGITLGFLSWKVDSIYPAIGLHMLKNMLAVSVILS
jgi:membrane protease YdiL (CAAX protease family)